MDLFPCLLYKNTSVVDRSNWKLRNMVFFQYKEKLQWRAGPGCPGQRLPCDIMKAVTKSPGSFQQHCVPFTTVTCQVPAKFVIWPGGQPVWTIQTEFLCSQTLQQISKCRRNVRSKLGPFISVVNWRGNSLPVATVWFGIRRMGFLKMILEEIGQRWLRPVLESKSLLETSVIFYQHPNLIRYPSG